jgi:hypothetical protein
MKCPSSIEQFGTIDTQIIQDTALAILKSHKKEDVLLADGIQIRSNKTRSMTHVDILDRGSLVFSADSWDDGDQIVQRLSGGNWRERLGKPV